MYFESMHPADRIVKVMERIYGCGMTTTSGGNISIKDDSGDVWITPAGVDKGSLAGRDIVCVRKDGTVVGNHRPSSELPFHSYIYEQRPDVKAVLHAHPPALVAFSIAGRVPDTTLVPNMGIVCGEVGIAGFAPSGSRELGEKIVQVMGKGINAVILENHGIVAAGEDLFKAFVVFETLEFCARLEINANRIGTPAGQSQYGMELFKHNRYAEMGEFYPENCDGEEMRARHEMCKLVRRAYNQKLLTSTQGTFSCRLGSNSFLITPCGKDRKDIEPEDMVRIENGLKEKGKIPDSAVEFHRIMYEKHPHINSIIMASPPNIMAFAVTKKAFDSKATPESHIVLGNVGRLPFGLELTHPERAAQAFEKGNPVAIIENDCIIAAADSLTGAYDRLEVAEFTAKALIAAASLDESY